LVEPDQKFTELDHGHELYCAGHFIQVFIAERSGAVPYKQKIQLVAFPYYAWGNRGLNSMRIWIPIA